MERSRRDLVIPRSVAGYLRSIMLNHSRVESMIYRDQFASGSSALKRSLRDLRTARVCVLFCSFPQKMGISQFLPQKVDDLACRICRKFRSEVAGVVHRREVLGVGSCVKASEDMIFAGLFSESASSCSQNVDQF